MSTLDRQKARAALEALNRLSSEDTTELALDVLETCVTRAQGTTDQTLIAALAAVDITDIASWDRRKTILDVYYDGENADYVADEDDFHKRYAGLIAVARWAAREALDRARDEIHA